jgi:growth factor-regulated tyrosine kinase substrate
MYPSIANVPNATGGAESFYTGNAQAEPYGRPQSTYYAPQQPYSSITNSGYPAVEQRTDYNQYPPQGQAPPQSNWQANDTSSTPTPANPGYPTPDQRNDAYSQYPPQQQSQRRPSYQTANPAPSPYPPQASTYAPEVPQQAPPPMNAPSQTAPSPSADPNAAFYFNNASQAPPQEQGQPQYPFNNVAQAPPPQQVPEPSLPQYAQAQSPQQYHSIPAQQSSPQQFSHQPVKQQTAPPLQNAPPPQQQAPYWQNTAAQPAWQAPGQTYSGYTQESFPSAPHHAPQQKVMEESLIDL